MTKIGSHAVTQELIDLLTDIFTFSEDGTFKATGTHIDFGENIDLSVTGTTAYISAKHPTGTAGYVPQFVSAGDSVEDSIINANATGVAVAGSLSANNDIRLGGGLYIDDGIYDAAHILLSSQDLYIRNSNTGSALNLEVHDTTGLKVIATFNADSTNRYFTFGDGQGNTDFYVDGDEGKNRRIIFLTSGSSRWLIGANSTAEGGSDVGSDLYFQRFSDAGNLLGTPLTIYRNTGDIYSPNNLQIDKDIYTHPWDDWSNSGTVVGWSSYSTKNIDYKKVGDLVFVSFYINGTSNSTGTYFTLPYNISADATSANQMPIKIRDNGIDAFGFYNFDPSDNKVTFFPNVGGSQWTASGQKIVLGQFFYKSA